MAARATRGAKSMEAIDLETLPPMHERELLVQYTPEQQNLMLNAIHGFEQDDVLAMFISPHSTPEQTQELRTFLSNTAAYFRNLFF